MRLRYTQHMLNYSKLRGCTSLIKTPWIMTARFQVWHRIVPTENTRDRGTLPQNLLTRRSAGLIPRFAIEYQCNIVQRQQSFVFKKDILNPQESPQEKTKKAEKTAASRLICGCSNRTMVDPLLTVWKANTGIAEETTELFVVRVEPEEAKEVGRSFSATSLENIGKYHSLRQLWLDFRGFLVDGN